ncbi:MAG: hypothetical protein ACXVDN_08015 [Ktedonobacteraceae bacterium]
MSWNPNQGQDPNQPVQPEGYPQQPGQQPGSETQQGPYQGGYEQPGYQSGGYQQPNYQPGGYQQQPGYQPGGYQQQTQYGSPYTSTNPNGPTSMGMDANVAAGLSYLFSIVGGLIFYFGEKQNRFVRFHAMQSILFNAFWIVLFIVFFFVQSILYATVILSPLALVLTCLTFLLPFAVLVLWIILMVYAFQGKYFKLPVIGDYAEKYAAPTP